MSEMEKILQNWDTADEYLNSKVEENKLPTFTTEEYERVKDSIPVGTKFIITDDEGGDEPEPSGGVTAVNSYIFRNIGDSYTISVKDKTLNTGSSRKFIPINALYGYTDSTSFGVGPGYIVESGGVFEIYMFANGSTSTLDIGKRFDIGFDENKEEITLTLKQNILLIITI